MAQGSQNMTSHQANKWTNLRTFTIGLTGHDVDGTSARTWTLDEMLGASTSAYFYRGDKTWSNELDNNFYLNGHLYLDSGKHIYMKYASTDWPVLNNHNNGNISVNGAGSHLDLGYFYTPVTRMYYTNSDNTVRTQFFEVNSDGAYALTRFGVNGQDTNYRLYVNGTSYFTGEVSVPSTLTVRAENSTNEGGQICLAADPNHSAYDANLDVYNNYFRIHSNGATRIELQLTDGGLITTRSSLKLVKITNTPLGIDTSLKIGTTIRDLHLNFDFGSGSDINDGYSSGITWGHSNTAQAGIYCQSSGHYGTRLHFATTHSYADGAYSRMTITPIGNVGIGMWNPAYRLDVNGNIRSSAEMYTQSSFYTRYHLLLWYNTSWWVAVANHDNGNIGYNAAGGGVYLGWENTNFCYLGTTGSWKQYIDTYHNVMLSRNPVADPHSGAAIEIREVNEVSNSQDSEAYCPRIGFHWGGRVAAWLGLLADGWFKLGRENNTYYSIRTGSHVAYGDITATNNLYVSTNNATGGGIILADDGDIVDLNDGYCSMRFSYGVRIFTANRGGSAVITLARTGHIYANAVHSAIWNDYAECRKADIIEGGYCVTETLDGSMMKTTERLQPGCKLTSDTYGSIMGETDEAKTPIAVAGRVLVYPYRNRNDYPLGAAVCSAPNGTVDIMTRDEIMMYPERIVGTVSEIPTYEIWHGGTQNGENDIKVNGRIWIYVR